MEELFELRAYLEQHRYAEALILLGEMEEMSKDDKINKIHSFIVIILLHLIKQSAEKRTTRSWNLSIYNSINGIRRVNKRRKAKGNYLTTEELKEIITEAYPVALKNAAQEAFEGAYEDEQLAQLVDRVQIEQKALESILIDA